MAELTHKYITDLSVGKRSELPDESYPHGKRRKGLMLQTNPSGNHTFLYRRLVKGKRYGFTLGRFPELTLAKAREMVDEINGHDGTPREAWDELYAPKAAEVPNDVLTVGKLINKYMDEEVSQVNRGWRNQQELLKRELAPYIDLAAADLTQDHVIAVVQGCLDRSAPRAAQEAVKQIRTLYNWGMGVKRVRRVTGMKEDVRRVIVRKNMLGILTNPAQGVAAPSYAPKSHHLEGKKLSAFRNNLVASSLRDDVKDILMIQLQTFCRVGEVAGMRWDELNLGQREWVIPAQRYKTGQPHTVMLSTQTTGRLREIKREANLEYVFPMPKFDIPTNARPMNSREVAHRINRVRDSLKQDKDFSSHSLRRSGATWLASEYCANEVRERLLGHKLDTGGDMAEKYPKHDYLKARAQWTQQWCDFLEGVK